MTREEAKAILKGFMENPLYNDIPKVCRAFDMAIKALEQEPYTNVGKCEDAISRQAVRDTIFAECSGTKLDVDFAKVLILQRAIKALPPVQPAGRWIPVTTRPLTEEEKQEIEEQGERYCGFIYDCELPDDGQEVLITTSGDYVIGTTFYNEGIDGCYFECYEDEGDVKAWMPLPEPYEPTN